MASSRASTSKSVGRPGLGKNSPLSERPRVEDEHGGSLGMAQRSYRGRTRCDGGGCVGDVTELSG